MRAGYKETARTLSCGSGFVFDDIVSGGARRDRTADLYNAIVALSQLSYGPDVHRK